MGALARPTSAFPAQQGGHNGTVCKREHIEFRGSRNKLKFDLNVKLCADFLISSCTTWGLCRCGGKHVGKLALSGHLCLSCSCSGADQGSGSPYGPFNQLLCLQIKLALRVHGRSMVFWNAPRARATECTQTLSKASHGTLGDRLH